MAFRDRQPPSLLGLGPLRTIGRWAALRVHGRNTNANGDLLTRKYLIPADRVWRLGQAYLGMLGLLALPASFLIVDLFYSDVGYFRTTYDVFGRAVTSQRFGHWNDLPPGLKVLFPLTIALHLIGMLSFGRWVLLQSALQPADRQ